MAEPITERSFALDPVDDMAIPGYKRQEICGRYKSWSQTYMVNDIAMKTEAVSKNNFTLIHK